MIGEQQSECDERLAGGSETNAAERPPFLLTSETLAAPRPPTLFYDADCGLCRACVRCLRRWDRHGGLHFEPLPAMDEPPDSVVWVNGTERKQRTAALVAALQCCGGGAAFFGRLLGLVPRGLRDCAYRVVARLRHWV